jgi:hypothetical protein
MFTIECNVGRLVELRIQPPLTLQELRLWPPQANRIFARVRGQVVACTDLRNARVFTPEVTKQLLALLRGETPHIERAAILVGESAVFSMQIARMFREIGGSTRRSFPEPEPAVDWLSELLTAAEVARLREFLGIAAVA